MRIVASECLEGPAATNQRWRRDWPPFHLIFFDCDNTLASDKDVDGLAGLTGLEGEVAALTGRAIEGELPMEDVYARLELLRPTREHLARVRWLYRDNTVPRAAETIANMDPLPPKAGLEELRGLAEVFEARAVSL